MNTCSRLFCFPWPFIKRNTTVHSKYRNVSARLSGYEDFSSFLPRERIQFKDTIVRSKIEWNGKHCTVLLPHTKTFCFRTCKKKISLLSPLTGGAKLKLLTIHEAKKQFPEMGTIRHFSLSSVSLFATSQVSNQNSSVLSDVDNITSAADMTSQASVQASLLFPDFPTIHAAESAITYLYNLTGLPWWLTVVTTAFLLRVVLMLPLTVYSFHNAARLHRLQPELKEIAERLKVEVSMAMSQFKWSPERAREEYIKNMKRLVKDLYIRDNCHPMKNTATFWIQTPVWFSVSYALRNLCSRAVDPTKEHHEACADLTQEGTLWFPDLTLTDSTWLLPAMMGAVTLFNIEMTHLNISEVTKYRKRVTIVLRSFALLFIPLSAAAPSAMVLYWVSSGAFAAGQNLLYEYSPFRRLVGLPQSETESNSPLRSLRKKAKEKYFSR